MAAIVASARRELSIQGPLDAKVLRAASGDPEYAQRIVEHRNDPAALRELLGNPPEMPAATDDVSELEIIAHGARALWTWFRGGMGLVSEDVHRRRLFACQTCPNLRRPPASLLYRMAGASESELSVCGLCGCVVERKAWLETSRCPDEDPEHPGRTRWTV